MKNPDLLTVKAAAQFLGVGESTLRKMTKAGDVPTITLGARATVERNGGTYERTGRRFYSRAALAEFLRVDASSDKPRLPLAGLDLVAQLNDSRAAFQRLKKWVESRFPSYVVADTGEVHSRR